MGFSVSEIYGLPVNAKSLVGSVMANLCGSHYPLHMAMVEVSSQRILVDKAFSVPKCVRLARMSHHSNRLLKKILGTVPREQRDDLSEIWGEELLSLEGENTSDFERQNITGKSMNRVGRVSRDNTKTRESILEEDLAKNVSLSQHNSFCVNRELKVKGLSNQARKLQEQREWMRSFEQLKAWEEIVISSDDEEALLRQITVSNSSGPSTSNARNTK